MFGLTVSKELEESVKALRAAAEQRANVLSIEYNGNCRDTFYDALATFAEEALEEIKRAKIGF